MGGEEGWVEREREEESRGGDVQFWGEEVRVRRGEETGECW